MDERSCSTPRLSKAELFVAGWRPKSAVNPDASLGSRG